MTEIIVSQFGTPLDSSAGWLGLGILAAIVLAYCVFEYWLASLVARLFRGKCEGAGREKAPPLD